MSANPAERASHELAMSLRSAHDNTSQSHAQSAMTGRDASGNPTDLRRKQILTLSGWTQPTDAVRMLVGEHADAFDYSHYETPKAAIEALAAMPTHAHVIAWSMGGLLAIRAIEAGAIAPEKLTLIAPPYQFVNGDGFHGGMAPDTFALFRHGYAVDTQRTIARFHGLIAKGDARMRDIMATLSHHSHVDDVPRWLPWLDDLGAYTHRQTQHRVLPPTQLIQGAADAIVPKAQADAWAQHYPSIAVYVWENAGHAPHLHDSARFLEQIRRHHGEIV